MMKYLFAGYAVRQAVKNGQLTIPNSCSKCGSTKTLTLRGKSRLHAHHPDYNKPLEIEWLCISCHRKWHGKQKAIPAKDVAPIEQIHALLAVGVSQKYVASHLGCDSETVKKVTDGWKRVSLPKILQRRAATV